jgi:protein-disulfide isomerase
MSRVSPLALAVLASSFALACGVPPPPPAAPAPVASASSPSPPVKPTVVARPVAPQPSSPSTTCSLGWATEPLWSPLDPALGDGDAPVTIVMFGDLQDPFTARATPTLRELMAEFGGQKVRLVFRHNPLPFHKDARPAAIAAQLVFDREGALPFFRFVDLALDSQRSLDHQSLLKLAREAGVRDLAAFEASMSDAAISARIDRTIDLAAALDMRGTPGFLINGQTVMGAQSLDVFRTAVQRALGEAGDGTDRACRMARANVPSKPAPPTPSAPPATADDTTIFRVPIGASPARGGGQPLVTIVMFGGYQDPFSKRAETTLQVLLTKYGADLRVVWKDKPLPFHKNAMPSASLARQAFAQRGPKGFWEAHRKLMDSGTLEPADLDRIATEVGISPRAARAALAAGTHKSVIEIDSKLGDDLDVTGTPTFFINGRKLLGAQPKEKFEEIIDAQLALAKAKIAGGASRAGIYETMTAGGKPPTPKKP